MANIGKDSDGDEIINVDAIVGANGANQKNDILAVQALLKYFKDGSTVRWTNQDLDDPDGIMKAATRQAIFDFQAYVRKTSGPYYWVSLDGRMSPYKAGVQLLNKQEWTIIALNNHCGMVAAARGEGDHVNAICRKWPFTVGIMLNRFLFF